MDLKELAKQAFDKRAEKIINDEKEKARLAEEEKQNTEKYVKQIINIFITSNLENERPIWGIKIDIPEETLKVSVAYSSEDIGYDKFFDENVISENYVNSIRTVKEFNAEKAERKYLIFIVNYFREHLSEYFLVSTAKTIELRRDINLQK